MEIDDLYPHWERERDAMLNGLHRVAMNLKEKWSPERMEEIFTWSPEGWSRSINDLLRHMAYVEHYVMEKLILDKEPKDVLEGSAFPAEDYSTFSDCLQLMRDVHETTQSVYRRLSASDLTKEISAFGLMIPMDRLLWSIVQEEAHHRGQIYLLLRIQGVAPPARTD